MVQKWYEVTCDYCGVAINHYIGIRPTRKMLEDDGVVCTPTKQFCNEICWGEWNHDNQEKRYLNLRQKGKYNK